MIAIIIQSIALELDNFIHIPSILISGIIMGNEIFRYLPFVLLRYVHNTNI